MLDEGMGLAEEISVMSPRKFPFLASKLDSNPSDFFRQADAGPAHTQIKRKSALLFFFYNLYSNFGQDFKAEGVCLTCPEEIDKCNFLVCRRQPATRKLRATKSP